MKRIFTLLLSLLLLSSGRIFSQDCVVLGCAAASANQVVTVNGLAAQTIPFTAGCWPGGDTYYSIVWQFFKSNGGAYSQTFTPEASLNLNWVMLHMSAPLSTNTTCAEVTSNIAGWTVVACNTTAASGSIQGPSAVGTNNGEYYAVGVVIQQNAQATYTFDINQPTLDLGLGAGPEPLTAANCDIVLPVKLSSFDARVSNCAVSLNWTSEIESGFKNYEVEYSSDGSNFKTIATLPAAEITGGPQKYTYTDPNPRQGNVYYRLKMVDADGKFDYSKIVVMKMNCSESQLTVYPNPVIDILNINITNSQDEPTTGKLFDSAGRLIYSHNLVNGTNTVNMSKFPGGVYLLQLISNKQVQHIKIIK